jgi:hypothetical protein
VRPKAAHLPALACRGLAAQIAAQAEVKSGEAFAVVSPPSAFPIMSGRLAAAGGQQLPG